MPGCYRFALIYILVGTGLWQCTARVDNGPSPPKTAEEELATFVTEPGLTIELVASEPVIQDPIVMTFDEDGRLWVVEMRGFMPDIDGHGERDRVGRISILEDTDGNGSLDKHTVFMDSLIMPRALAVVRGGALVVEEEGLWFVADDDGNGTGDRKELIDPDYAGSKMPEHAGNGLLRAMDNWYYNAKSRFRYAFSDGKWVRDSTEFRGQWGITQDSYGRIYYNYNWSQLHTDLVPPNYLSRNRHHTPTSGIDYGVTLDRHVYPIRSTPAVNRGYIPGTLSEDGRLLEFTAACSPYYYRGDAFPQAYDENVYVCEPSGNLVKRNVVTRDGVYVAAKDPHPGTEFLASTDERFRPVYITSGPDGFLYVADMYRGLIQHGAYVTPYLREQTLSRNLVKPVNYGRIWRIKPASAPGRKSEKLSAESNDRLIALLEHPNGWYRDMAQRLLVERNDAATRDPLWTLARSADKPQTARLHALWTLRGIGGVDAASLLPLLSDPVPSIKTAALRMMEPFIQKNPAIRVQASRQISAMAKGSQPEVLQAALSAYVLPDNDRAAVLHIILSHHDTSAVMRDAVMSSAAGIELRLLKQLSKERAWDSASASREIVTEMLTAAVLRERNADTVQELLDQLQPSLPWRDKSIVNGLLVQGAAVRKNPITLPRQPVIMRASRDEKVQQLSSLFAWPGHVPDTARSSNRRTLADADLEQFALGRKHYLATCAGCHGTDGNGLRRMAPPLVNSEWVLGNEKRLTLLILHGIEGTVQVAGKLYGAPDILPVMPSHSTMDDGAIRAVMTYIRNEWGNQAPAIGARLVGRIRHTSQGRVQPWKPDELNAFIEKYPEPVETK